MHIRRFMIHQFIFSIQHSIPFHWLKASSSRISKRNGETVYEAIAVDIESPYVLSCSLILDWGNEIYARTRLGKSVVMNMNSIWRWFLMVPHNPLTHYPDSPQTPNISPKVSLLPTDAALHAHMLPHLLIYYNSFMLLFTPQSSPYNPIAKSVSIPLLICTTPPLLLAALISTTPPINTVQTTPCCPIHLYCFIRPLHPPFT